MMLDFDHNHNNLFDYDDDHLMDKMLNLLLMNDLNIHDYFDDIKHQHYHDVDDFVDLMNDEIDVDQKNIYLQTNNKDFHLLIVILYV